MTNWWKCTFHCWLLKEKHSGTQTFDHDVWPCRYINVIKESSIWYLMSLILLYLCTRYDVCVLNLFSRYDHLFTFVTLIDLHLLWDRDNYLNVVTMASSPIWFLWNSNTNLPRAKVSDIPIFFLIGYQKTEIQRREVNRELR